MNPADFAWLPVFLVTGLASVAASLRLYGHWFSPLSIFVGVNSASLFMYHLRFVEFSGVSLATHLIVLAAFVAFLAGTLIAGTGRGALPAARVRQPRDVRNLSLFFNITGTLATLGWLIAAGILAQRYGLGNLVRNIWLLQLTFQMQFIGYLNMIGILVLPAFVIKAGTGTRRWYDHLILASAIFGLLLAGIKAYVFYSVITALTAWSAVRPDRFRFLVPVLALVMVVVFFVVYTEKVDVFVTESFAGSESTEKFGAFLRPYVYFAGPWPAMDTLVTGEMEERLHFGAVTLEPVWKILGEGLGLVESVPFALPFTFIGVVPFNVYSFFGEVYWDWGWPGVMAVSFLLGLLSARLYLRARRPGYWGHILIYAIVAYGVFLTCFNYNFRFNMVVMLLYTYGLGFLILRKGVLVDRTAAGWSGRG